MKFTAILLIILSTLAVAYVVLNPWYNNGPVYIIALMLGGIGVGMLAIR